MDTAAVYAIIVVYANAVYAIVVVHASAAVVRPKLMGRDRERTAQ
jgi:hypothetical protein